MTARVGVGLLLAVGAWPTLALPNCLFAPTHGSDEKGDPARQLFRPFCIKQHLPVPSPSLGARARPRSNWATEADVVGHDEIASDGPDVQSQLKAP